MTRVCSNPRWMPKICRAAQDIAAKENERTRAEVQAAAARKAGAKLQKDASKGEADRSKHAVDLEAMKAAFKVQLLLSAACLLLRRD